MTAAACAAIACCAAAPDADAQPNTREETLAAYDQAISDTKVPAGWTGSGCAVGTESQASLDATLRTINILRDLAGLDPVTLNPSLAPKALAAAVMMKAAGALSHSPGPSWPCYTADGADGAGHSNLYLGRSGASAMIGYVEDPGVPSLGHRTWLLDYSAGAFASGSTGSSNALWVIDAGGTPGHLHGHVAWPPAGMVPWPWVFSQWSVQVFASQADLTGAQVKVTAPDGTQLPVSGVSERGGGYGSGRTLGWNVTVPSSLRLADATLDVSVTGITLDGQDGRIDYQVRAVAPPAPPTPPPGTGTGGTGGTTGTGTFPGFPVFADTCPPICGTTATGFEDEDELPVFRPPAFRSGPRISRAGARRGRVRAGSKLKVTFSSRRAAYTRVQWRRAGTAIRGATGRTYTVRRRDLGRRLSVRVTLTGEDGSTRTATASLKIRRR